MGELKLACAPAPLAQVAEPLPARVPTSPVLEMIRRRWFPRSLTSREAPTSATLWGFRNLAGASVFPEEPRAPASVSRKQPVPEGVDDGEGVLLGAPLVDALAPAVAVLEVEGVGEGEGAVGQVTPLSR